MIDISHIDVLPWLGIREPFSSLSHLAGAVVFASLSYSFVQRGRGDATRTTSLVVFSLSTVLLLLSSGVYHIFWPGPWRELLLRIDVAGVFVLIAASSTPVHAILFTGLARWGPLFVVWVVAISGIVWRTLYCQTTPGPEGIAFFLLFGWGGLITAIALWRQFGWSFIQPAVFSGLSYTIGAVGLVLNQPILIPQVVGAHEIWHLCVLIGLSFHWFFVTKFANYQNGASRTIEPRNTLSMSTQRN